MTAMIVLPLFPLSPFSLPYTDHSIIGYGWGYGNPGLPRFSPPPWADMMSGFDFAAPLHGDGKPAGYTIR